MRESDKRVVVLWKDDFSTIRLRNDGEFLNVCMAVGGNPSVPTYHDLLVVVMMHENPDGAYRYLSVPSADPIRTKILNDLRPELETALMEKLKTCLTSKA